MVTAQHRQMAGSILVMFGLVSGCRFGGSLPKDLQGLTAPLEKRGPGEVVVYYANETNASSSVLAAQYQRIQARIQDAKVGLLEIEQSALDRVSNAYQADLTKFSAQVQADIAGLERQICGVYTETRKAALFVFTNALTKAGRARVCLPGVQGGQVQEVAFQVGSSDAQNADFRYSESPLASENSFYEALKSVRSLSAEHGIADFDGVLIVKSHGGGDLAVAPKLSYRSDLMTDSDLIARFKSVAVSIAGSSIRLVDLKLANGQRLGDVLVGDSTLENILISKSGSAAQQLKLGDLKLSDLNFGPDGTLKIGDLKLGELKVGDLKLGDLKVGELKLGELKVGDLKQGELKQGELKLGELKLGELKVGDLKLNDLKIGALKANELKSGDLKNDLATDSVLASPGITKTRLADTIAQSGFNYQLVFLESCDSDPGFDLTVDLIFGVWSWDGKGLVGSLYYSDNRGLQFETVNYGSLPKSDAYFSDSLGAALEAKKVR